MRARHALPPPTAIDWRMRPVSSAQTSSRLLDDGRLELKIEHAPLTGVTPRMLDWWFRTASQDMQWRGQTIPRYRVWHPRDHISLTVVARNRQGEVGAGAKFHIV